MKFLKFALSDDDYLAIAKAAAACQLKPTTWARQQLILLARDTLPPPAPPPKETATQRKIREDAEARERASHRSEFDRYLYVVSETTHGRGTPALEAERAQLEAQGYGQAAPDPNGIDARVPDNASVQHAAPMIDVTPYLKHPSHREAVEEYYRFRAKGSNKDEGLTEADCEEFSALCDHLEQLGYKLPTWKEDTAL
jgi:hypothetical protein